MYNATMFKTITKSVTLKSKNGVELRMVLTAETEQVICYELYADGDLLNKFKSEKTAVSMWKDFAA